MTLPTLAQLRDWMAQRRSAALTERFGLAQKWARFVALMEDQA